MAQNNFVSPSYARRLALSVVPDTFATTANGSSVKVTGVVHGKLKCRSTPPTLRCRVADLGSEFELILCGPWLVQHAAVLSYQTLMATVCAVLSK